VRTPRIVALAAGTLLLAIIAFLQPLRFINSLFYDLTLRNSSSLPADSVIVVAIDEASIGKIGAMPWPRSTLAKLISTVNGAGATAIAIDMLFPQRPEREQSDSLAAVFSRVPHLVLPFKAGRFSMKSDSGSVTIPGALARFRFMRFANQNKLGSAAFYSAGEWSAMDTQFTRFADRGGFLNVSTSASGQKLREVEQVIRAGSEFFPSFAVASVAAYRGLTSGDMVLDGNGSIALGGQTIPLTSYAGTSFINFRKNGIRTVSAADILNGGTDVLLLRGKLVFIGLTDPGEGADFFLTPVSPQFPGVMLWANAAQDIIDSTWVRYGGGIAGFCNFALLLLLFPGCALLIPSRRRIAAIVASAFIAVASVIVCILIFRSNHYFWDPTGHLYGWLFMLLWLAAQKTVPSLGSGQHLILEPPKSTDDTGLPPPKKEEFEGPLPQTDSFLFVSDQLKASPGGEGESGAGPQKIREIAGGAILKCLGSGGMADVYLVWNPRLEAYRAVKVLKPGMPQNIHTRFETEIRIFSKLDHPNIVRCHSVGDWYSLPYVEMEFVNGASMDAVLGACKNLSVEQALGIGILVCRALHYAHTQSITIYGTNYRGIVHRDLKPANIMLSRAGRIKLADFGLARPAEVSLNTVESNSIAGTLPYLAPEQIDGGELSGQVDVYAMGATIYEFLTGVRAFPQTQVTPLLNAKIRGDYKPIPASAHINKNILAVIDKAMAVRMSDRYPTAQALQNDLERVFLTQVKSDAFSHIGALTKYLSK
jgi:CHASE2 domain-containing sensor protein